MVYNNAAESNVYTKKRPNEWLGWHAVDDASTRELGAAGGCSDQRFAALTSIGDCINQNELKQLLETKTAPVCYVWCDSSPSMHITQGISVTVNVNKMIKAGCRVKILMADWLARLDPEDTGGRFGGDLTEMKELGSYNLEVWKAAGMDLDGVEPVWLSDGISRNENVYWPLTMDVARVSKLGGIKRFLRFHASKHTKGYGSIDRYARRDFNAAEILSPCLQSAGMLLFPEADMWLLSLDQRGAHMLAREYCDARGKGDRRPVALFNSVLPNLLEIPEMEMCGDSRWAVFMEDSEHAIGRAMRKAFCPPGSVQGNPCLEYIQHIILPWFGKFEVVRRGEDGGNKTFVSMEEFAADYKSGALHPPDVKQALERALNMMLQPVRDHFRNKAEAMQDRVRCKGGATSDSN
ncbi:tyrosine--tRNA ligase 1, cytoplasmic-like [Lolium rigidum]|uniref:tyrosine--tRNA ligase 1, cytoplasmic-like n=1 Tax=Lolium rigidum TaxID=89674 RepID=UPI001F5C4823|nr:tyrosine--tRNA ligase 1, cytoplasmic-like [Lolium rigidum]